MENTFYDKLTKDEIYLVNSCFFAMAVAGLFAVIIGPLLPAISEQYKLNNTVSGALLSAQGLGALVGAFLVGVLPTYLGRKKSLLFFSGFVIIGFTIMILTGKTPLLILAFLLIGVSSGGVINSGNVIINETFDSSPVALNVFHALFTIGAISAPFLVIGSTKMVGPSGWKMAAGIIVFMSIIMMLLFSKMESDNKIFRKDREKISYGFLKNRNYWISAGILFFYIGAEKTINGWVAKYFIDSNIMVKQNAQMFISLFWVTILIGRLTCAFVGDKISKPKMLLILSMGTAVSYFLLLSATSIFIITIAMIGLGFFMGGIVPINVSDAGKIIRDYPMAMGMMSVISGFAAIIMPMITGSLADAHGIFTGMIAILAPVLLMIGFVIWNLKIKDI